LAYETATPPSLPDNAVIRLLTPACFLVTRLAAYGDRGRRNPTASPFTGLVRDGLWFGWW
jgi:hypothetical protein